MRILPLLLWMFVACVPAHAAEVLVGEDVHPPVVIGAGSGALQVRTCRLPGRQSMLRIVQPHVPAGAQAVRPLRMAGDHLLVRFAGQPDRHAQAAAVGRQGMAVRRRLGRDLCTVSFPVTDAGSFDRARERILRIPGVVACEPDILITVDAEPDDPRFGEQWALKNTGQEGGTPGADIRMEAAWDAGTGSRNVLVGIIDTGIDRTHPDLAPNMWQNPGESGLDGRGIDRRSNGLDDDGNGYIDDWRGWDFVDGDNDPHDLHGHGTHCAGVIGAAGGDSSGIAGVNWQVSMVGLRFLDANGSGLMSDAIQAIDYARGIGCHITSNSWGAAGTSEELNIAIRAAGAAGQLFVCAAGNDNANTDLWPRMPANCVSPNLISVMATERWDGRSWFSNFGDRSVHIAAPGQDILSTVPDAGYTLMSGTSMATPHVAGACALVKAQHPSAGMDVIRARVLSGARPAALACATGGILDCAAAVRPIPAASPVISVLTLLADGEPVNHASPGTSLTVGARLVNIGGATATGIRLRLEQADAPPVAVIDDDAAVVGSLAGSAWADSGPQMSFTVPEGTASPCDIHLRVVVLIGEDVVGSQNLTLPVRTMSSISGRVTSGVDGAPIPGLYLYCYSEADSSILTGYTDGSGRYAFSRLPDNSYRMGFSPFGGWKGFYPTVVVPPSRVLDVVMEPSAEFLFNWTNGTVIEQGRIGSTPLTVENTGHAAGELTLSPEGILCDMGGLWHMAEGISHDEDGYSLTYALLGTGSAATGEANAGTLRFRGWAAADWYDFSFWERNDVPSGGGSCVCEVSGDGGSSWTTVWTAAPGDGEWRQVFLTLPFARSPDLQIRWVANRAAAAVGAIGTWNIDEPSLGVRFDAYLMTAWVRTEPEQVDAGVGEERQLDMRISAQGLPPGRWNCYPRFSDGQLSYFLQLVWEILPAPVITMCNLTLDAPEDGLMVGGGAAPLLVVLANQGAQDATGLVVSVQSEGLTVTEGMWSIGTLPSGGSALRSSWTVAAPIDYDGPEDADVVVTAQDGAGRTWSSSTRVHIVAGPSVGGMVRDKASGLPIPGAQVEAGIRQVLSRSDGRFRIGGIAEGAHLVRVTAAGYLAQELTLSTPQQDAVFELDSRRLSFTPGRIDCSLEPDAVAIVPLAVQQAGSLTAAVLSVSWSPVPWLGLPDGLSGIGTHQLTISAAGLEVGTYEAWIDFTTDGTGAPVIRVPIALEVHPHNGPPVTSDLDVSVVSGADVAFDCSAIDPDGDVLIYAVLALPAHGEVHGSMPSVTYRSDAGYVGADSVIVSVSDGINPPVEVTVRIQVLPAAGPGEDGEAAAGGAGGCGSGLALLALLASCGILTVAGRRRRS